MNIKLQHLFETLEHDKLQLLKKLSILDNARLNYSTHSGQWSINQILAHLITAEEGSLNYMKKKSLAIDTLDDSGFMELLKSVLLKYSQRIPFKYNAPKKLIENTRQLISIDEINLEWDQVRDQMKLFLDDIADKNIRKKIYKHHVAGYLDVLQALDFIREHLHHHLPQVERLLNKTK